ncbi:MAG TPA: HAD-IB family phosphatase [Candidatus Eisenbacteria bacterium]|nr:HAD-IB family phosphatase [Candidatus Eisenbacteria bacterium]
MSDESQVAQGIAAFFDIDGTLVPEPSLERRMFRELRHSRAIPLLNYARWGVEAIRLLPRGLSMISQGNKKYLRGLRGEAVLETVAPMSFFEEGVARVEWHARQGHEIVLVSGMVKPVARLAAVALECELEARGLEREIHVSATRLEERGGAFTGRIVGAPNFGEAKGRALHTFARAMQIDLHGSHAYGNSLRDVPMFEAVGRAHAVNPGKELARVACQRDWPIWHWHHEKSPTSGRALLERAKFQIIGTRT